MAKRATTVDYKLLAAILILLGFGLLFLYSASTPLAFSKFQNGSYYFTHQLLYGALIGLGAMYVCSKIDYHKWQKLAPFFVLVSIVLLVLVLIPGVGLEIKGAKRWLDLGPITFQPAELAKLALIFYIASWVDKRNEEISDFYYGLIPVLLVCGFIIGLIILEPDLGTTIAISSVIAAMLFLGGSRLKHLGWLFISAIAALLLLIKLEPYRLARITTFLNPKFDPTGIGYQINQAMLAVGSAGLFGQGYTNSRQKYNFLPEVMGDSIFAVIVEEIGFIGGTAVVLFLLYYFAFRGLKVAVGAPDTFGKMLASGIVAWIIFQAFINISAIIGLLPLTGIPLPLTSYGSTAMIVALAGLGILLNISRYSAR
jgi:cell division protein FtsW